MVPGDANVSVVVPAYNAQATIARTLASISAQTWTCFEAIVVDDGSRDGTSALVERHAAADPRFRLLRQANQGVACARNAGLNAATGRYVAFIDADDLWAPQKLAMQVAAMESAGGNAGLCCTGVANIDADDRILGTFVPDPHPSPLRAMCRVNLAGNGSAALMPREKVVAAGGFDPDLRRAGAEGCEDWKLHLRLVEHHDLVVVPDILTGYRESAGQMSARFEQMLRSAEIVLGEWRQRRPDLAADLDEGLRAMRARAVDQALAARHYRRALSLARPNGWRPTAALVPRVIRRIAATLLKTASGPGLQRDDLPIFGPDEATAASAFPPAAAQPQP